MPEAERLETLALLERNRADAEAALAALPIVGDGAGAVRGRGFGGGARGRQACVFTTGPRSHTRRPPLPLSSRFPPAFSTMQQQRRRRDDLERRLAEVEEAARVFGRRQVLVRA